MANNNYWYNCDIWFVCPPVIIVLNIHFKLIWHIMTSLNSFDTRWLVSNLTGSSKTCVAQLWLLHWFTPHSSLIPFITEALAGSLITGDELSLRSLMIAVTDHLWSPSSVALISSPLVFCQTRRSHTSLGSPRRGMRPERCEVWGGVRCEVVWGVRWC